MICERKNNNLNIMKIRNKLGMMVQICSPSSQEVKVS